MLHQNLLNQVYDKNIEILEANGYVAEPNPKLTHDSIIWIETLAKNSENFLGVLNVTITSLTEKSVNPKQDIRLHQAKMKSGYSGRTLDTKIIAPWLKSKKLKSMVESGWLTRSLEQDRPYTLDYAGAIRNKEVKIAFLNLLDLIEKKPRMSLVCLEYLIQLLIIQREQNKIEIEPQLNKSKFSINQIIQLLNSHFGICHQAGTARLPVLAVYSIYQCLTPELERYKNMKLMPLGSHTSSDKRSGDIGDIQVNNGDNTPFEGVEIKYNKTINLETVGDSFEKIKNLQVNRYYLLSTKPTIGEERAKVDNLILEIQETHGCQIIVNGLLETLKYYLRLISNPDQFVQLYTDNLLLDPVIKVEHKQAWKILIE